MASEVSISVEGLVKQFRIASSSKRWCSFLPHYQNVTVVNEISFQIGQGECVGLVGPNGAGKSTTMKMLTGILKPTGGKVSVLGRLPHKERRELASQISALFGQCSRLWFHLSVKESLSLLSSIYEIPLPLYRQRSEELISLFSVSSLLDKSVRQLSLGERMRCELVASFLHDPKVLFLDEPTIGLDGLAKETIRTLLRSMCEDKKCTLILTSHDMEDIDRVCDRVLVMKEGKIGLDATPQEIRDRMGGSSLDSSIASFYRQQEP